MDERIDVVVIGAGIAGLSAAQALQDAGLQVVVVEKSRGFGGRAASRSIEGARVDHGAQYFTVRGDPFAAQVAAWQGAEVVAPWGGGIYRQRPGGRAEPPTADAHPRYIAPEGMNALGKALADGLAVRRERQVTRVRRSERGWLVGFDPPQANLEARQLLITAPVPQALALLDRSELDPVAFERAQRVRYAPCFALMAGYADRHGIPPWSALRPEGEERLAFLAHDASKRPPPHPTTLVVHATPSWTRANYEGEPTEVTAALLAAAGDYWSAAPAAAWTRLHRWRYAQPEVSDPDPYAALAPALWLAGDAYGGAAGRIEGAFESGRAAAAALLQR
jgi:predicted NAD/FAD-dependent oxidoreductase